MEIEVRERVEAGAAILDQQVPDWVEKVDLEELDIASGSCCVAAQAVEGFEGDYMNAWEYAMFAWGITTPEEGDDDVDAVLVTTDNERARELGFLAYTTDDDSELMDAWTRLIEERRS